MSIGIRFTCVVLWLGSILPFAKIGAAQDGELSVEERQQIQSAERFLEVLQKNPKRGIALDRVYSHHLDFGTLDSLLTTSRKKVEEAPEDGNAWMLLGLLQSQQGDDESAAKSFEKAASLIPQEATPAFYRGQSLVRTGNIDDAIACLEQSLTRKSSRADRLDIYQQLGRVLQRAQRGSQALNVWKRLEEEFHDDPRVLEQIAVVMSEEGDYASAIPRLERLATLVTDDYRRTGFRVQSASLKIKSDQREAGLRELESVLTTLNPSSWLYRDVRKKIDDTFLASNNQDGLVKYYANWLDSHNDDVEVMARLAKYLVSAGRAKEADDWMKKAISLAPSRTDLRKSLIDHWIDQKRIHEAVQQYEELCALEPSNSDYLRDWGKWVLRDTDRSIEDRRTEAIRVWNQLKALRPDDASHLVRVADLFRNAEMYDEARALFERAVQSSPDDSQYREYLGEFLHHRKQADEAKTIWKSMAEGARRNTINLSRLAEVYRRYGFLNEAIESIEEACSLDRADFALQLEAAKYMQQANRMDAALEYTAAAEKLASSDDERETTMRKRIELLQSSGRLDSAIVQLATEIRQETNPSPERWHTLAQYCEADKQLPLANEAINHALQSNDKSVLFLSTASRLAELEGNLERAIDFLRKLVSLNRRAASEYLATIAKHELQRSRPESALKAAEELVLSAPGNTDHYEFLAKICFQAGKIEEGIGALRKAVRINPNEPHLSLTLASALAERGKPEEALDVYWRTLDRAEKLEDQTFLVEKMVPLYQVNNRMPILIDRLSVLRRNEDKNRAMTLCLAQAYLTARELPKARQELESLLTDETRDTALLQQLSKVCYDSQELDLAIQYQRRLVNIAPGAETEMPLAKLLQEAGKTQEANEMILSLAMREEDPIQQLRAIDSLLAQSDNVSALTITQSLLSKQPDNWELLFREGLAFASQEDMEQAAIRFHRLLSMDSPHETLGASAKAELSKKQSKAKSENLQQNMTDIPVERSPLEMLESAGQIQMAVQSNSRRMLTSSTIARPQAVWMPASVGLARMASFAWLLKIDPEDVMVHEQFSAGMNAFRTGKPLPGNSLYDYLYIATLLGKDSELLEASRSLAREGGMQEREFFLSMIQQRSKSAQLTDAKCLSDEDLRLMMECFEKLPVSRQLASRSPTQSPLAMNSPLVQQQQLFQSILRQQSQFQMQRQIALSLAMQRQTMNPSTTTRSQSFVPSTQFAFPSMANSLSGSPSNSLFEATPLTTVLYELQLAAREEELSPLLNRLTQSIQNIDDYSRLLDACWRIGNLDKLAELYPGWIELAKNDLKKNGVKVPTNINTIPGMKSTSGFDETTWLLSSWIGKLGMDNKNDEIFRILSQALDLAIERSKELRSKRSILNRPRSVANGFVPSPMTIYPSFYGSETNFVPADFPPPNDYVDTQAAALLFQVHEVMRRNGERDALERVLRQRVIQATGSSQTIEQMFLVCELWWKNEKDEAIENFLAASSMIKDDIPLQLDLAAVLEQRREFVKAMELVESVAPSDPTVVQKKEWLRLKLAFNLGENEKASEAANKLSTMTLDAFGSMELSEYSRRLGLHSLTLALQKKITRPSTRQSVSASRNNSAILQSAKARLATPMSSIHYVNGKMVLTEQDSAGRQQLLNSLKANGTLEKLVKELEADLEKSARLFSKQDQLAELYRFLKQPDKIENVYQRCIAASSDAIKARGKFARYLAIDRQYEKASEIYLDLFRKHPESLSDQMLIAIDCIAKQGKLKEIEQPLRRIDVRSVANPAEQIEVVNFLADTPTLLAVAAEKFGQLYESMPMNRGQLLGTLDVNPLSSDRSSFYDAILPIFKTALIPRTRQSSASPWFGLEDMQWFRTGNAQAQGHFSFIVRALDKNRLLELSHAVREAAAKDPNWLGGQAMSALLDLHTQRVDSNESVNALRTLFSKTKLENLPYNVVCNIAHSLELFESAHRLEFDLLRRASDATQLFAIRTLDDPTPVARYLKLAQKLGEQKESRDWMRKMLSRQQIVDWNTEQFDPMYFENAFSIAEQLTIAGYPLETMRVLRQLQSNPLVQRSIAFDTVPNTTRTQDTSLKGQFDRKQKNALEMLQKLPVEELLNQLTETTGLAHSKLHLDLYVAEDIAPKIKCVWMESVESISNGLGAHLKWTEEVFWQSLHLRLSQLHSDHPDDASIRVAMAWCRLKSGHSDCREALNDLLLAVESQTFVGTSTQDRKFAMAWLPIWLIARDCIAIDKYRPIGEKIATKALEIAMLQSDKRWAKRILWEWSTLLPNPGDSPGSGAMHSKLLEVIASRPTGKTPLTLQQIGEALALAKFANERGLNELARRAVREAYIAGVPMSNNNPAAIARIQTRVQVTGSNSVPFSSPLISYESQTTPQQTEWQLNHELYRIVLKWKEMDPPAMEVYELLRDIMLPENRVKEVVPFVTSLPRGQEPGSLSKELVYWAKKVSRLDELAERLGDRQENPVSYNMQPKPTPLRVLIEHAKNQPAIP